ncbi:MAG: phospholipase A [Desulfobacterales bacterium]|nr:phospholipase A [Desulfobacterales bacterium]
MSIAPSGRRRILSQALVALALILIPLAAPAADEAPGSSGAAPMAGETPVPRDPKDCSEIIDPTERLRCFDRQAEKEKAYDRLTFMERQWDLVPHEEKRTFVLRPHRTNYILVAAYNDSPNEYVALENDEEAKAQETEAKFQISFKARAWEQMFALPVDFWIAYTQLSFWQLYNSAFSSPFRDTNYEPEALFNWRTRYAIPGLGGLKLQFINFGFNHQSNGRSEPMSRSWNRLVANFGLEKGNFNTLLKTWYRIPEDEEDDDNPDIIDYMGYGELWMAYVYKETRLAVMLRDNWNENHGAFQVDLSIPLAKIWEPLGSKFALYVQYFNGYGECLLDYNDKANRIGAGFMVVDWI